MATSLHQALRDIDLFASLDDDTISQLMQSGATIRTRPGTPIIREGDLDSGLRVVLEGSASVSVDGDDRGVIGPGDYVGEISLIDGEPRSATLTAGPDGVTTFAVSAMAFGPLLDRDPRIARALLQMLCARIRRVEATADRPPAR